MELEKEITVKVNCNFKELHDDLMLKGFNIIEEYQLNDIYMLSNSVDIISLEALDIIKNCILIRDVVDIEKKLVYKYKKYDDVGNILKQGKLQCQITSIDDALYFMKAIDYDELFRIEDKITVYSNTQISLAVQYVNNKYLFIEVDDNYEENRKYSTIDEMKTAFASLELDCDQSNYFVKKAEIIFKENKKP